MRGVGRAAPAGAPRTARTDAPSLRSAGTGPDARRRDSRTRLCRPVDWPACHPLLEQLRQIGEESYLACQPGLLRRVVVAFDSGRQRDRRNASLGAALRRSAEVVSCRRPNGVQDGFVELPRGRIARCSHRLPLIGAEVGDHPDRDVSCAKLDPVDLLELAERQSGLSRIVPHRCSAPRAGGCLTRDLADIRETMHRSGPRECRGSRCRDAERAGTGDDAHETPLGRIAIPDPSR